MTLDAAPRASPIDLSGSPHERGRQQAERCPDMVGAVRRAVDLRMAESEDVLSAARVREYLADLRRFHDDHDPEIMEEIKGIGTGFGIPEDRLFDYLMLSLVADLERTESGGEECTAFAASAGGGGAIVAKNRDYRLEHAAIQRVFRHRDPGWGGREVLCVGSLGSPGNFSSGMNSDGFALADTATRTIAHGVGRHRYFLLTRLQTRCTTVAEALGEIAATSHAGGGVLVLGDATGCVAAVELGSDVVAVEVRRGGWVGRTNHHVAGLAAGENRESDAASARLRNSERRLLALHGLLGAAPRRMTVEDAAGVLSYRGETGGEPLCRQGGRDLSVTLSGSVYDTRRRHLRFANGYPSPGNWTTFSFSEAAARAFRQGGNRNRSRVS